ncbi:hypothetical protein DAEQUDRAFT_168588 [Daedalea quercina L-15889]|uniref:Uncharacterized protein n=1 Tax=Daedalea quercina L-15889 TaxID=1314783 RepID=A0A165RJM4_9APHY|nr:hypothetical protein DAEQUDRAFT_168588 [Daedalea quercina L-15889]
MGLKVLTYWAAAIRAGAATGSFAAYTTNGDPYAWARHGRRRIFRAHLALNRFWRKPASACAPCPTLLGAHLIPATRPFLFGTHVHLYVLPPQAFHASHQSAISPSHRRLEPPAKRADNGIWRISLRTTHQRSTTTPRSTAHAQRGPQFAVIDSSTESPAVYMITGRSAGGK